MVNIYDISRQDKNIREEARKIADYLVSSGLIPDMRIRDEHIREVIQKKNELQYHNTKLLLEQYREIAWQLQYAPYEIAEELDWTCKDAEEVIKALNCELLRGNKILEYRIDRLEHSVQMFQALNEALTVLKERPDDGEVCYQILYMIYIQPEKKPIEAIREEFGVSTATFYRLRSKGIKRVSNRLWYSLPSRQIGMLVEAVKEYVE